MKKIAFFIGLFFLMSIICFGQQRVVLIEQFTNSSCAPCGNYSPLVYDFVNNNSATCCAIAYHTSFPYSNDSMYWDNSIESDQRVAFYTVSGVPYSIVDGNVYDGSSSILTSTISSVVNNRAAVFPKYTIESNNLFINGDQLSGSFKFISNDSSNTGENLVAHIVVIEKNVLKNSYLASPGDNIETSYGYVMRKMLPDASGIILQNTDLNGSDSILTTWQLNKIKNINELRVVAFVQNTSTKEVFQAQLFNPDNITAVEETSLNNSFSVFPNPAKEEINIVFETKSTNNFILLYNSYGETIYNQAVNGQSQNFKLTGLPSGMYFIVLKGADLRIKGYKKIIKTVE